MEICGSSKLNTSRWIACVRYNSMPIVCSLASTFPKEVFARINVQNVCSNTQGCAHETTGNIHRCSEIACDTVYMM